MEDRDTEANKGHDIDGCSFVAEARARLGVNCDAAAREDRHIVGFRGLDVLDQPREGY